MAVTCDCTQYTTDAACFNINVLNPKQLKALMVLFKAYQLAAGAVGGTNYTAVLASTLVTDSVRACCGLRKDQFEGALLGIAYENAVALSSPPPSTLTTQLSAIKCIQHLDDETLDKMLLFLRCKISSLINID